MTELSEKEKEKIRSRKYRFFSRPEDITEISEDDLTESQKKSLKQAKIYREK